MSTMTRLSGFGHGITGGVGATLAIGEPGHWWTGALAVIAGLTIGRGLKRSARGDALDQDRALDALIDDLQQQRMDPHACRLCGRGESR